MADSDKLGPDVTENDGTKKSGPHWFVRVIVYSLFAAIIFLTSRISWWLALILFVVFALYVLIEAIVLGMLVVVIVFVLGWIYRSLTGYRFLKSEGFNGAIQAALELSWWTIVMMLVDLYYILLILGLGYYLFCAS